VFLVKGKLIAEGSPVYAAHRVRATFRQRVPVGERQTEEAYERRGSERRERAEAETETATADAIWVVAGASADVSQSGVFTLELPELEEIREPVVLEVLAPTGELLAATKHGLSDLESDIEIEVEPYAAFALSESGDPFLGQQVKLTGRVIDAGGRRQAADLQVLIWAVPKSEDETAEPQVVFAARTDRNGSFSGDYPRGTFDTAEAVVAGGGPIPIALEDDALPLELLLTTDLPEEEPEDTAADPCECHKVDPPRAPDAADLVSSSSAYSSDLSAGRCVDFTMPNRTLEEFDYYRLVRTTEPEIKALTVDTGKSISIEALRELLKGALALAPAARRSALMRTSGGYGNPGERTNAEGGGTREEDMDTGRERARVREEAVPAWAGAGVYEREVPRERDLLDELAVRGEETVGTALIAHAVLAFGEVSQSAAAQWATAVLDDGKDVALDANVLSKLIQDPEGFTPKALMTAERLTAFDRLTTAVELARRVAPARADLAPGISIDWDEDPTTYQATSIAHGHVLQFKQVWRADGYSLGDLLYSLPLAACQKKQIAVVDWDRAEMAARTEARTEEERIFASLNRDRDISEIVRSSLHESVRGGSTATAWGFAGGFGVPLGPVVIGGGGGMGGASSSAWQDSARSLSASSLQQLRDRTMQSASAVRGQRSTVVQTVRQGEAMRVQTEVVANYNHCHAITMEYFEVLRHFQVAQELVSVQECLFVPLLMSFFDSAKALRWRGCLERWLRNPALGGGFDALHRISQGWARSDVPAARYSDEAIRHLDGDLYVSFVLPRPKDKGDGSFEAANWTGFDTWLGGQSTETVWTATLKSHPSQATRDQVWRERIAPRIASRIVQALSFTLTQTAGGAVTDVALPLDATLVSNYSEDWPLYVSVRLDRSQSFSEPSREEVSAFNVRLQSLPLGARVVLRWGSLRYRTDHLSHHLFSDWRVDNDLGGGDAVMIPTPVSRYERRNPRDEDRELSSRLLAHLNEFLEYYHQAIWRSMDANRRYMLLDGFVAPNSQGRSVASVIENRLLGVMGNCLVMPVAPGFHLDPTYRQDAESPIDLLNLYAPTTPIPPTRISVPTRGVFTESTMGSCNSCEQKDDTRFWRFEESLCGDEPARIAEVSTESRRTEPGDLTPKEFPQPMINLQNAPAAPDPLGLGAALQVLARADVFKDITGLTENQRNALAAFKSALGTAQLFGGQASALVQQKALTQDIDKALQKIQGAERDGLISKEQANELANSALKGMVGERRPPDKPATDVPEVKKAIQKAAESKRGEITVTQPEGSVSVRTGAPPAPTSFDYSVEDPVPLVAQPSALTCWAATGTMMQSWRDRAGYTIRAAMDRIGATWRAKFDAGSGLTRPELESFVAAMGLSIEPPQSYSPQGLISLLRRHGPLWIVTDQDMRENNLIHARVVTGMYGEGDDPDKVFLRINDPQGPRQVTESFRTFAQRLEAPDAVVFELEVMHF
jgi:hypothetical protein